MAASFSRTISGTTYHFKEISDKHYEVSFDYCGTPYRIAMKRNSDSWKIEAKTIPIDVWYAEDTLSDTIRAHA